MESTVAVVGGVVIGLLVFAGMLQLGVLIVRWLKLPQDDLPEGVRYTPPAPPMVDRQSPEAARATAALQERRRALFARAHALQGKGDAAITGLSLEPAALDRADADLRRLEQAPAEQPATT